MSNNKYNGFPKCRKDTCFANENGRCVVLTDTKFNGDCPFYKERWAKKLEDMRCQNRTILRKEKLRYEQMIEKIKRELNRSG